MGGTSADRLTTSSAANIDGVTLGATGGDEEHTLLSSESGLPDHTHPNGARDGSVIILKNATSGGEFTHREVLQVGHRMHQRLTTMFSHNHFKLYN